MNKRQTRNIIQTTPSPYCLQNYTGDGSPLKLISPFLFTCINLSSFLLNHVLIHILKYNVWVFTLTNTRPLFSLFLTPDLLRRSTSLILTGLQSFYSKPNHPTFCHQGRLLFPYSSLRSFFPLTPFSEYSHKEFEKKVIESVKN